MSDTDSFISEVSDELRRDRLFYVIRRYGWIAIAIVVILVGAAALWEYRRAQQQASAEEFGDAIVAALDLPSPEARRAALLDIDAEGTRRALLAMLAADTLETPEAEAQTAELLDTLAADADMPPLYRDLAVLKSVMLAQGEAAPQDLIDRLEPLTIPGAPYRLLALEQTALAELAAGDREASLAILQDILGDPELTRDLATRTRQLVVALGGTLEAA
ncbi:hypothetical protein LX81_01328 [Palleronia aestuarii]|uniref:Tetratricopeptide repeat-like domain-containing protein n=1 Tax=Palleronia aestuarii TaxID=568105 RepID=A0A2W7NDB2_9RHOB|nr:hypothetical protein [Palleronia aestuarii]PZX17603.1 hypothetical protein LX81_01328 [Palleronia aestuarii]